MSRKIGNLSTCANVIAQQTSDLVRSVDDEDLLRCIRGDDSVGSERFRRKVIDKNTRTGEPYADGGLVQWQIYRTYYQDNIAARLIAAPNQDGALHLPEDVLPGGKKMLRQFANVKKNDKGFYMRIDGGLGKDYRDLLGYNEAVADMIVGKAGWTEKAWRADLIAYNRAIAAAQAAAGNGGDFDSMDLFSRN